MEVHTVAARVHGRFLVDVPTGDAPWPVLVGFHGYAERAEDMLSVLQRIRGQRQWLLVSIQALNRFYTRSQEVVANWMTREDRELAIDDNLDYVASVLSAVRKKHALQNAVVYAGFSQGVAMAYRAVAFAADRAPENPRAAGAILLAGDIPPDVVSRLSSMPPLLIGRGTEDGWYTEEKAAADQTRLLEAGRAPQIFDFRGGHVWDESFITAAGEFLDVVARR